jgi:peroxiredoxin
MKKLLVSALLLWGSAALAEEYKLGSPVGDFQIQDVTGKPVAFSSLRGNTTVVIFMGTKCPISNNYNERMTAVYKDYTAKGVKFVFINANFNEPASEVVEHAKSHALGFPIYKDEGNRVADAFGATVTPETYVLDEGGVMRYHGYIDDAQNVARVQNHGLRNAIDAVMAHQTVAKPETKAFGCTIKRQRRAS